MARGAAPRQTNFGGQRVNVGREDVDPHVAKAEAGLVTRDDELPYLSGGGRSYAGKERMWPGRENLSNLHSSVAKAETLVNPLAPYVGGPYGERPTYTLADLEAPASIWNASAQADRDERVLAASSSRGIGLGAAVPAQIQNRADVWGGGLRRMTSCCADGSCGPQREDEHYYAPRYVPVGFGAYDSPNLDPMDYIYYRMSGWRVAVPRTTPGPAVRALLLRIYQHGPESAGYARTGSTLVPAALGPGDRRLLAQVEPQYGSTSRKYLNY